VVAYVGPGIDHMTLHPSYGPISVSLRIKGKRAPKVIESIIQALTDLTECFDFRGIVVIAASKEIDEVTVNALVRSVVYAMLEARKGPMAFPIVLAEFSIPKVTPLFAFPSPASPRRREGAAE